MLAVDDGSAEGCFADLEQFRVTAARNCRRFETQHGAQGQGAGAELQYCVDQSQFDSVNTQTGSTTPLKNPYYLEQDSLVRESDGSWLVTYTYGYYLPNQHAQECVP